MTVEELEALGSDSERFELLDGVPHEVTFSTLRQSANIGNIAFPLIMYVDAEELGDALLGDPGFVLSREPDTLLGPDVAFVRSDRVPPRDEWDRFTRIQPDLAVEVMSSMIDRTYMQRKLDAYKRAGVPLIWFADPDDELVLVDGADRVPRTLHAGEVLDGEEVVPGFRLPVAEIFG